MFEQYQSVFSLISLNRILRNLKRKKTPFFNAKKILNYFQKTIDKSFLLWYSITRTDQTVIGAHIVLIFGEVLKLAEEAPLLRV